MRKEAKCICILYIPPFGDLRSAYVCSYIFSIMYPLHPPPILNLSWYNLESMVDIQEMRPCIRAICSRGIRPNNILTIDYERYFSLKIAIFRSGMFYEVKTTQIVLIMVCMDSKFNTFPLIPKSLGSIKKSRGFGSVRKT